MDQEKMTLEDWLDDLCVRFIINLPRADLSHVERICFQVEEAHWFYEDFIRPLDPTLPNMSLRHFCLLIFKHCPLFASFSEANYLRAFDEFLQYKTRIPVRGAIMLNHSMDSTVLVRGWKKSANWSFPRGKINKDEDDLECALREVFEETGYDIRAAGLIPENNVVKYIEVPLREQIVRLYVFRDVPQDTLFEPQTRKEIGKIQWYKLQDLPAFRKKKAPRNDGNNVAQAAMSANKFYMVAPFLAPLKKWVFQQKKKDAEQAGKQGGQLPPPLPQEDVFTEDDTAQDQPLPPVTAPNFDHMDQATRELRRVLKIQPPTEGLQISSPTSNENSRGAALMSLLQAPASSVTNQPQTPLENTFPEASQPHTPHHHHPTQRLPISAYENPPQFPIPAGVNSDQAYQHRPQVRMTYGADGQPNISISPHVYQDQQPPPPHPIRLIHPQPQPPQVQKALFMGGSLPRPNLADQAANRLDQFDGQGQAAPRAMRQPTGHSMNLLNMLKGNSNLTTTSQHSGLQDQQQANRIPPTIQQQMHPSTAQPRTSSGQYVQPSLAENYGLMQSPQFMPTTANPRPPPPATTDSQKSLLLSMFKQPGISPQPVEKPVTTAEALRQAAQENGQPLAMNPNLNLPFGALSIASRPRQQPSPKNSPANVRRVQERGQPGSPMSPRNGAQYPRSPATRSLMSQPPMPPSPLSPRSLAYPYGGALNQMNTSASAQAIAQAPAASALPMPNLLKGLGREQSAEQQNKLLSLFGKASVTPAQAKETKGKEPAQPVPLSHGLPFGSEPAAAPPTNNKLPVATIGGAGAGAGASAVSTSAPRRGSQSPLSPADKQFLLGFLKERSRETAR